MSNPKRDFDVADVEYEEPKGKFNVINLSSLGSVLTLITGALLAYATVRYKTVMGHFPFQESGIDTQDFIVLTSSAAVIIFFAVLTYLNSKRVYASSRVNSESYSNNAVIDSSRFITVLERTENSRKAVEGKIDAVIRLLRLQQAKQIPKIELDDKQKDEVYKLILSSVSQNLTSDFFDALKVSVKDQIVIDKSRQLAETIERGDLSIMRLRNEVATLSGRANINLALGASITSVALAMLSYFIIKENFNSKDVITILVHFIPRLSLIIFIELFSFFFLKLYRTSLHEIKYYQNELTNLEVKYNAAAYAANYGSDQDISSIIQQMMITERNFKLQKGESTVELEKNKVDTSEAKSILDLAIAILKKDK